MKAIKVADMNEAMAFYNDPKVRARYLWNHYLGADVFSVIAGGALVGVVGMFLMTIYVGMAMGLLAMGFSISAGIYFYKLLEKKFTKKLANVLQFNRGRIVDVKKKGNSLYVYAAIEGMKKEQGFIIDLSSSPQAVVIWNKGCEIAIYTRKSNFSFTMAPNSIPTSFALLFPFPEGSLELAYNLENERSSAIAYIGDTYAHSLRSRENVDTALKIVAEAKSVKEIKKAMASLSGPEFKALS